MGTHRPLLFLALPAGLIGLLAAGASIPNAERPASPLTCNLIMSSGLPYVPSSGLGRALGGAGRYDPAGRRLKIQPGAGGAPVANPGPLAAFAAASRAAGEPLRSIPQTPFVLWLAGQEIAVANPAGVLSASAAPALSLNFMARPLGGQATFDAGRASWVLPAGGAASPLAFR
ncbi:MAG: hypothetical protein PHQ91_12775 [Thermoanaerobaculaceae bacterium]|nr:hypothetical protein [Thermoanaerobaculaceae bacterium]TAM45842.1 MAG: hypothetical protein EPN53_14195 [Acidobacteriota bacterium]